MSIGWGWWRRDGTCALGLLDCEAFFFENASRDMDVPKTSGKVIDKALKKEAAIYIFNCGSGCRMKGAEFFEERFAS